MIIEFQTVNVTNEKKSHSHDYGQFIFPFGGAVHIEFEDKSYVIDENSIGYIPAGAMHKYSGDKNEMVLIINVSSALIKERDKDILLNNCRYILNDRLQVIADYLKQEAGSTSDIDSNKYLFFYIYDKIVEVRRHKSVEYIHNNYNDNISIKYLADLESYNATYFTDWFKKNVGMTPTEYIKRIRIEKAKDLLLTTKYNLTQIAGQVGYSHSTTFCKVFKEITDISAKEYREISKKE